MLLFLALAGGLWLALPYIAPALGLPAPVARLLAGLRAWRAGFARYPELGGYVHDTQMSQWIPPNMCHYISGTWTDAAGAVADTICKSRATADATTTITVPISLLANAAGLKGSYVQSIDLYYEILGAAADAVDALINYAAFPADEAAIGAIATKAFSYDAGHDTAAERDDLDQHKMTLTLTTPLWLDNDDILTAELTVDAAATTALTFFGARVNYTLRL